MGNTGCLCSWTHCFNRGLRLLVREVRLIAFELWFPALAEGLDAFLEVLHLEHAA